MKTIVITYKGVMIKDLNLGVGRRATPGDVVAIGDDDAALLIGMGRAKPYEPPKEPPKDPPKEPEKEPLKEEPKDIPKPEPGAGYFHPFLAEGWLAPNLLYPRDYEPEMDGCGIGGSGVGNGSRRPGRPGEGPHKEQAREPGDERRGGDVGVR